MPYEQVSFVGDVKKCVFLDFHKSVIVKELCMIFQDEIFGLC